VALARLEGRAAALGIRPRDLTVDDVSEIAGDVARRLGHEPADTVRAVLRRLMPHELR
jgi:hypothetical protein